MAREDALDFVDQVLGAADSWPSPLLAYRLSDDFQEDWKAELGHWLKAAERCGFLDEVVHLIMAEAKRPTAKFQAAHPNDDRHLKLHQHVAVCRAVHYFTGLEWQFEAYEPESGGEVDVDVSLIASDGTLVEMQVKAPDQPGEVKRHSLVNGEFDDRIQRAVTKGIAQLRAAPSAPSFVVVCANRNYPLALSPEVVTRFSLGLVSGTLDGRRVLRPEHRGLFFTRKWERASGIVLLDVAFGLEWTAYPCTVILNPSARVRGLAEWFPRARVLDLDGGLFRWRNGEPQFPFFPDGTVLASCVADSAI